MIVDPDFTDHWKTRLLVELLGDEAAPVYLLRLWSHCQHRRAHAFQNITQPALKALCRFPGSAELLEASLLTSGFIRRDGGKLVVHQWEEYNSSLIANWENGKKGGRPKSNGNPNVTHGLTQQEPMVNPNGTQAKPIEKSRLDSLDSAEQTDSPPPKPPKPPEAPASPSRGVVEGKDSAMLPTTEQSKRIARIFHRNLSTPWSEKEVKAYKKIGSVPEEDLAALERYYAANWPPKREVNILRHDLVTFLNNFPGEIDRAKSMKGKGKSSTAGEWLNGNAAPVVPVDPAEEERIRQAAKEQAKAFKEQVHQL